MSLSRFSWLLVVAVPATFLAACGDDDSGAAANCLAGTMVTDGGCIAADGGPSETQGDAGKTQPQKTGLTCGEGTVEEKGKCVAAPIEDAGTPATNPETPVKGPVGGACQTDKDCMGGTRCLTGKTLPGNFCTVIGCNMDNPCPVGSTCYQATETTAICMPYCDNGSDCREGYNCQPLYTNAINICAPSCALTDACSSGTKCNEDSGLCEIASCDPKAKKSKCGKDETCWPDTQGLSSKGGLCLRLCDPKDPKATCKLEQDEVCQPLETDPENAGFCAPPVCSKTAECPAGAICHDSVCQPPALCDDENPCGDDDTCVSGKCLSKCPSGDGEACSDIHPGLTCATALDEPACLPVGAFPGSPCRANRDDACSDLQVGDDSVPMVCQDDVCLPNCGTGGDALCEAVSDTLSCAVGIFDEALCLPKGTFPGGPCGPSDSCAQDLQGNAAIDMQCVSGRCLIGCDESGLWSGYGDALCQFVDPSLTCATAAGSICVRSCDTGSCDAGFSCLDAGSVPAHENACLPNGSFPGSACGGDGGDECDSLGTGEAMKCVNQVCVVDCDDEGDDAADDAVCTGVDPSLTCSESAGHICVIGCVSGQCLPGFSCLDAGGENACLPTGTFPGSPCRATEGDECSPLAPGVDQTCVNDVCVVACDTGNAEFDDALCAGVDASLTCSESAGNVCVIECAGGDCPEGFSCLGEGTEDACLPNGSFPGSACGGAESDQCDPLGPGVDQTCVNDVCVVVCDTGNAEFDDALCAGVDGSLTCSETAGNVCVIGCVSGQCLPGFSCFDAGGENACLPNGSFPGSACGGAESDQCDPLGPGLDQTCVNDVCAIVCDTGDPGTDDALCAGVDGSLTCSETAGNVCVIGCVSGQCLPGFSCFDAGGENACLPNGSFPGSACGGAESDQCDPLGPGLDQTCVNDVCAIVCDTGDPGTDDALCAGVDGSLTCSETAGNVCVIGCVSGQCLPGFSCLLPGLEDACLPDGTFPGSACRTSGTACDSLPGDVGQRCIGNTCAIDCNKSGTASENDDFCAQVGTALGSPFPLTCSETATNVCVPACQAGACIPGYFCFDAGGENACFPSG